MCTDLPPTHWLLTSDCKPNRLENQKHTVSREFRLQRLLIVSRFRNRPIGGSHPHLPFPPKTAANFDTRRVDRDEEKSGFAESAQFTTQDQTPSEILQFETRKVTENSSPCESKQKKRWNTRYTHWQGKVMKFPLHTHSEHPPFSCSRRALCNAVESTMNSPCESQCGMPYCVESTHCGCRIARGSRGFTVLDTSTGSSSRLGSLLSVPFF